MLLKTSKAFPGLLFLCMVNTGLAVTVSGRLVDKSNGEPVFRAEVYVVDTEVKRETSEPGIFAVELDDEYVGRVVFFVFARYRYESKLLPVLVTKENWFLGNIELEMYERQPEFFLLPSLTITGQVTDESGKPLEEVGVLASSTIGHAFSNRNGMFRIHVEQIREIEETEIVLYKADYRTKRVTISSLKQKNYRIQFEQAVLLPTSSKVHQRIRDIQPLADARTQHRGRGSIEAVSTDSVSAFDVEPRPPVLAPSFASSVNDSSHLHSTPDSSDARSPRKIITLRFQDSEGKYNLSGVGILSLGDSRPMYVSNESGYLSFSMNEFLDMPDTILIRKDGYVAVRMLKGLARKVPVIDLRPEIKLLFIDGAEASIIADVKGIGLQDKIVHLPPVEYARMLEAAHVRDVELQVLRKNRPKLSFRSSEAGIVRLDSNLLPARCIVLKKGFQKLQFVLPRTVSDLKDSAPPGLLVQRHREIMVILKRSSRHQD